MAKIYLDPGHGGADGGAGSGSYLEKTLVLNLGLRLKAYLLGNFNCTVYMSRDSDKTLSLSARTSEANRLGADFFLSIHYNSFTSSARGYEDFTYIGNSSTSTADRIRNTIHNEVVNRVLNKYNIPNRGKKKANFHVLRESNMPSILVETLFVSNSTDQRLIREGNAVNDFVKAYGEGIGKALNLKRKATPVSAPPTTGTLYKIQLGAFKDRDGARDLVTRLQRSGFSAYFYLTNGLYKVQGGAFKDIDGAREHLRNLQRKGFSGFLYRA